MYKQSRATTSTEFYPDQHMFNQIIWHILCLRTWARPYAYYAVSLLLVLVLSWFALLHPWGQIMIFAALGWSRRRLQLQPQEEIRLDRIFFFLSCVAFWKTLFLSVCLAIHLCRLLHSFYCSGIYLPFFKEATAASGSARTGG